MTVADLIDILKKYPSNIPVIFSSDHTNCYDTPTAWTVTSMPYFDVNDNWDDGGPALYICLEPPDDDLGDKHFETTSYNC
jgi:hypothetical protein